MWPGAVGLIKTRNGNTNTNTWWDTVRDPLQSEDDRGETIFFLRGGRQVSLWSIRSSQDCHNYLISPPILKSFSTIILNLSTKHPLISLFLSIYIWLHLNRDTEPKLKRLRWRLSWRYSCWAWTSIYPCCFRGCFRCFVHSPHHPAGGEEEEEERRLGRGLILPDCGRNFSGLLRLSLF